jgi:AcrR family transcriptional regulator
MAETEASTVGSGRRRGSDSLTRDDWISGAWDMLGESGLDGVRIEPLARRLGVTKGSFYWHLKGREELLEALLGRWFSIWDDQTSPEIHEADDPADRIWALFRSVIGRVTRGQTVALRMLSHSDSDLAARIEERDNQRLAFLMSQLEAIGFPREEARVRGQIYQAIMSGEYLRSGGLPPEERIKRARDHHLMLSTVIS